jgi:hypothetical protein
MWACHANPHSEGHGFSRAIKTGSQTRTALPKARVKRKARNAKSAFPLGIGTSSLRHPARVAFRISNVGLPCKPSLGRARLQPCQKTGSQTRTALPKARVKRKARKAKSAFFDALSLDTNPANRKSRPDGRMLARSKASWPHDFTSRRQISAKGATHTSLGRRPRSAGF